MIPVAEDFSHIAQRLKQIEEEKAKMLSVPLPDVQPVFESTYDWAPAAGYIADYDPA